MTFKEATDRAMSLGVTAREIAEEIGVSWSLVNRARMNPDSSGHRSPPDGWRPALVRICLRRSRELSELAEEVADKG